DKIDSTTLHGAHRVFNGAVGGDHDDGEIGIAITDVGKDLEPVAIGQSEVQKDEIVSAFGDAREAFFARLGTDHTIALEFEQRLQRLTDSGFVIDDENGAERAAGQHIARVVLGSELFGDGVMHSRSSWQRLGSPGNLDGTAYRRRAGS